MTSFVDVGLGICWLVDSETSNMFLGRSGRNQIKIKDCSLGHNKKIEQKFCQKTSNEGWNISPRGNQKLEAMSPY